MRVRELMTREVVSCGIGDSLASAARAMWDRDCGALPVVESDRVVGMLTDRDVCMAALMSGRPLHEINVGEAMSRAVFACGPEDDVEDAQSVMRMGQVRRLPVVDGTMRRLVGVVSLCDFLRAAERSRPSLFPGIRLKAIARTLAEITRPSPKPVQPGIAAAE